MVHWVKNVQPLELRLEQWWNFVAITTAAGFVTVGVTAFLSVSWLLW
jgi:hypothetical protein